MKNLKTFILALGGILCSNVMNAESLWLPKAVSDGMVLQRNDTARVWGKATPGSSVSVKLLGKTYKATAADDGNWIAYIPTTSKKMVGGPYKMEITAKDKTTQESKTLNDIYVGDVWLCSGQSNMDLHCGRLINLYKDELATDKNPAIHLLQTAREPSIDGLQEDIHPNSYGWESLDPKNIEHWSSISYFLAKEMYARTGVPQGMLNVSMGGCNIVAYMPEELVEKIAPKETAKMRHLRAPGFHDRNLALNRVISQTYSKQLDSEDPGMVNQWMRADLDDSNWEVINQYQPNIGDTNGRNWCGTLWFRKEIDVPADWIGQDSLLRMGYLIDADWCYVNGKLVGSTGYQYPPRRYKLPEGTLHAGKNTICIRLRCDGGERRRFMPDKPYKLWFSGGRYIELEGEWKMMRGAQMSPMPQVETISRNYAASLYGNTIYPLRNMRIAGIVWYQGESNAGSPQGYGTLLTAMIQNWRESFGGNKPTVICQLANHMERHADANYNGTWSVLREEQDKAVKDMGNAGLVTLLDLGEWNDIHPSNKKEAAQRVAGWMKHLYLGDQITTEGPTFESAEYKDGKAIVHYKAGTDHLCPAPKELKPHVVHFTKESPVNADGTLKGFALMDKDGKWHWGTARIEGNTIVVTSSEVPSPCGVRYGWDDDPIVSLYNLEGFPAAPFRNF